MAKYLVTGGGGFVGKALCKFLRQRGDEVFSLSRKKYLELEQIGVHSIQADLTNKLDSIDAVLKGCQAVFHVAAKVEMWGRYSQFFEVNVRGTRHIIDLCRRLKIPKLIYTSSPSVVADGSNLSGIDESYPYPAQHLAFYPATKALAEQEVLAANNAELATISLRPHLVYGPGDNNFIPSILKRAKSGRLMQVGEGTNLTDLCYIDDCVKAHVLAEQALNVNPACRGRAFFISQGQPVNLWGWVNEVLLLNGLKPIQKKVSKKIAWRLAYFSELMARSLPFIKEPFLTRFLVCEMSTDHYFDISAAKLELGYLPQNLPKL